MSTNIDWMDEAPCSQVDPETFHPDKGESAAAAIRICKTCDVRNTCLEYALTHDIEFGVWGAVTQTGRKRILRKRMAA